MKFTINPVCETTEPQYFKTGETTMKMVSFESKIKGLKMHLEDANGIKVSTPITDTMVSLSENISAFGFIWFEWEFTDKEYVIELVIN